MTFKDLNSHAGHNVEIVYYGDSSNPDNVALKCKTCHEEITNIDSPEESKRTLSEMRKELATEIPGYF